LLDSNLAKIAKQHGVKILEEAKVKEVVFKDDRFSVSTSTVGIQSKIVAGTFGKRSNLDVKWSRDFIKQKPTKLNNYIGVKYHVKSEQPFDTIALHNFKNGYCGISKIEEDRYCLCYLTTAENLKSNNNSIAAMEKNVLKQNPLLQKVFDEVQFLYDEPLTISQISFEKKSLTEDHLLMIGDAAGMITPLCGNGMSMALHGSKIAFECIDLFLKRTIDRLEMEARYTANGTMNFQTIEKRENDTKSFWEESVTNLFIGVMKYCRFLFANSSAPRMGNHFSIFAW
jgi:flavin-dependent dehydrogenase